MPLYRACGLNILAQGKEPDHAGKCPSRLAVQSLKMAVQSLKRLVDPRDIAALAVFLASDAAKSISGQMLPIDNDMQQAS